MYSGCPASLSSHQGLRGFKKCWETEICHMRASPYPSVIINPRWLMAVILTQVCQKTHSETDCSKQKHTKVVVHEMSANSNITLCYRGQERFSLEHFWQTVKSKGQIVLLVPWHSTHEFFMTVMLLHFQFFFYSLLGLGHLFQKKEDRTLWEEQVKVS